MCLFMPFMPEGLYSHSKWYHGDHIVFVKSLTYESGIFLLGSLGCNSRLYYYGCMFVWGALGKLNIFRTLELFDRLLCSSQESCTLPEEILFIWVMDKL